MFSLCITTYNRYDMLIESFQHVLDHPLISEIVISDDASDWVMYDRIKAYCKVHSKIRLFRNDKNVGMSLNKKLTVERATCEWCILLDSDNQLSGEYLEALSTQILKPDVILAPDAGYQEQKDNPRLDYRRYDNWYISKHNIKNFLGFPQAAMMLNTCNYCVNRQRYLEVYQYDETVQASDTIWFNYLWLKSGGAFVVVPRMRYYHRIHAGSGFMENRIHNEAMCAQVELMIKQM